MGFLRYNFEKAVPLKWHSLAIFLLQEDGL